MLYGSTIIQAFWGLLSMVLILIFLENALRLYFDIVEISKQKTVLILIFLENALRLSINEFLTSIGKS